MVIVGSNTAESHPVLATRVKRAHKLRGQKLIVSDLRENEMARRADHSSASASRARIWCGSRRSAVTCSTTVWRKTISSKQWVNGLEEYREESRAFHAGVCCADLRPSARNPEEGRADDRRSKRVCILWAMGVTQHSTGRTHRRRSQTAAGDRKLHAAGDGRVSAARAQQRAGRKRPRRDAGFLPGYQAVDDPRSARSSKRHGR